MTKKSKDVHLNNEYEYSRILSAAVVNARFRQALLKDPAKAISGGYRGEKFNLGNDEQKKLSTIQANNLAEFATKLAQVQTYSYTGAVAGAD